MEIYGKELEPRLPAGITDGLRADLATLTGSKVVRPASVKAARAKTGGERALAKDGADLLSRLRHALRVCPASGPEVLKAVGVGVQVNPGKTDSVASSLSAFLDASKAYVDAFRTAGILDADLEEARALMNGLLSADDAQQTALDTKKSLTEAKDAAQLRIEQSVLTIAAVGIMTFRKSPVPRAVFEKLAPKTPAKPKKTGETKAQPTKAN